MRGTRVLVVDDELSIIRYVSACLHREGYEAVAANNGQDGLLLAEQENPALIILDIKMPKVDGFEVCRRLREWTQAPIIMLSAIDDQEEKVRCLNLGADDYVTKPFGMEELLARVRAVLRRTEAVDVPRTLPEFGSGDLVISFAERRVTVGGREVELTSTEYSLLQELVVNAGKVLTHVYLLNKVWGSEYRDEKKYLHVFIGRLRRKIESGRTGAGRILNVRGVGYQFRRAGNAEPDATDSGLGMPG